MSKTINIPDGTGTVTEGGLTLTITTYKPVVKVGPWVSGDEEIEPGNLTKGARLAGLAAVVLCAHDSSEFQDEQIYNLDSWEALQDYFWQYDNDSGEQARVLIRLLKLEGVE